jgi:hypothetical protein
MIRSIPDRSPSYGAGPGARAGRGLRARAEKESGLGRIRVRIVTESARLAPCLRFSYAARALGSTRPRTSIA